MSWKVLNKHTFFNNVSASSVSDWYPVDWNSNGGSQIRSIYGVKSSDDTVLIETRILNALPTSAEVIATAAVWVSGVTTFSTNLQGPFTEVRARKTGANGGVTIVGIV